jgi:hypothetical protein
LTGVLHVACGASELVHSTVVIFAPGMLVLCCQKFFYGVVCAKVDFDVGVLE